MLRTTLSLVAGLLALIVLVFLCQEGGPPQAARDETNGCPIKEENGTRLVFVKTSRHPDGSWLPLVTTTKVRILERRPEELLAESIIQVLNEDDTVMFQSHVDVAKRMGLEAQGRYGWPVGTAEPPLDLNAAPSSR
jgi:hypothetical protein